MMMNVRCNEATSFFPFSVHFRCAVTLVEAPNQQEVTAEEGCKSASNASIRSTVDTFVMS